MYGGPASTMASQFLAERLSRLAPIGSDAAPQLRTPNAQATWLLAHADALLPPRTAALGSETTGSAPYTDALGRNNASSAMIGASLQQQQPQLLRKCTMEQPHQEP